MELLILNEKMNMIQTLNVLDSLQKYEKTIPKTSSCQNQILNQKQEIKSKKL